jgi:hypothetical protein
MSTLLGLASIVTGGFLVAMVHDDLREHAVLRWSIYTLVGINFAVQMLLIVHSAVLAIQ